MKVLIKLIKLLLRKINLNDTCTGGVGSFLVFNLVYAYFLYLKRSQKNQNPKAFESKKSQNLTKTNSSNSSNNFTLKFKENIKNYFSSDEDSYDVLTDDNSNSNFSQKNEEDLLNCSTKNSSFLKDMNLDFTEKNKRNGIIDNNDSDYFENECDSDHMEIENYGKSYKNNIFIKKNLTDENILLFGNLGDLFLGFLKFYVFKFDYNKFGISNINEGKFFVKSLNKDMKYSDSMIWVENFTDKTHNISRGTKKFPIVLNYFKKVFYYLKSKSSESLPKNLIEYLFNLY